MVCGERRVEVGASGAPRQAVLSAEYHVARPRPISAGSAAVQGDLWNARAQDWADVQEIAKRPLFTAILQEVMQGPHMDLLDVGCGSGLFAAMAAACSRVSGIDAAGALLAIAKRRTPQAEFQVGDMETLPFDSRTFEVVTAINAIEYATNPIQALEEARRVCVPKGRVIIATIGRPEECDTSSCFHAIYPPGRVEADAPQPFALARDGALVQLAARAGLQPGDIHELDSPLIYPDEATALRGFLCSGPSVKAILATSEAEVREAIRSALQPFRTKRGGFHLRNHFRYVVARVP